MFPNGDQEEAVLGQALHRSHQDVGQSEAVALFVGLTPRQVGREEAIVAVQLATIILTSALLRTVRFVRFEQLGEGREAGHEEVYAHRVARGDAVLDHGKQVQRPKGDVGLAQLTDVGEELVLVHVGQEVVGLDGLQAGKE